ncbi:hypothetical protein D3C76_1332100 [compost metagenome]
MQRPAVGHQRMIMPTDHPHPVTEDRHELDVVIRHPHAADGKVHLPLDQQLLHAVGGAVLDADLHFRVLAHKPREQVRQQAAGDRRHRGNAHLAYFVPRQQAHFPGDAIVMGEQILEQRQTVRAEWRQLGFTALLEQWLAELLFELAHGQRQRRLRAIRLPRRAVEAFELGDEHEITQLSDLQLG